MLFPEPNWLFPLIAAVQIVGLASAWLARASQSSQRHYGLFQAVFFFALTAVATTALAGACYPSAAWLLSGITLPVMIVGTTYDFGRRDPALTVR